MATGEEQRSLTTVCSEIANNVGKDWRRLGRQLGIEDPLLDNLEEENQRDGRERAYQMMLHWQQRNGVRATVRVLLHHVEAVGRKDIAQLILDTCSTVESRQSTQNLRKTSFFEQAKVNELKRTGSITRKFKTWRHRMHVLKIVQRTLKHKYKTLQMKGLLWMQEITLTLEEYYVEMSMVGTDKRGQELKKEPVKIHQLFKAQMGEIKPTRILVEGGPGFGKSTLAAKLAYDWAKKERYMQHFDLVILLPLRHFHGDLVDVILSGSELEGDGQEYLLTILQQTSHCVLLILDGYDEISLETEKQLFPLLNRQILPHINLVITSRVGEFTSLRQDASSRWSFWSEADIGPTFCSFIDKRVSLEGMNATRQEEFFKKHVQSYPEETVLHLRSKLRLLVDKSFLKCPLFFLMLLVIFRNEDKIQNIQSKCDLYKSVFNFVFKRYFKKKREPIAPDADLFTFDSATNPSHVQLMRHFGSFAVDALQMDKLSFSLKDVTADNKRDSRIAELGLLTKSVLIEGISTTVMHEPVHRSLLEFAAAYSLWLEYNDEYNKQWEEKVCALRPNNSSSLFLPFLVGLMAENASAVFQALKPYAVEYWNSFRYLELTLLEIKITPLLLDLLVPFLPVHWKIKDHHDAHGFFKSHQHQEILNHGLKMKRIKLIKWTYQCVLLDLYAFPYDTEVEKIILTINDSVVEPSKFLHKYYGTNRFRCQELCCVFRSYSGRYQAENLWKAFLAHLCFFEFQHISFYLTSSISVFLYRICKAEATELLQDAKIHVISCDVKEDPGRVVSWLTELIKSERLKAVEIRLHSEESATSSWDSMSQKQLNTLLTCASHSTCMTKFSIKAPKVDSCLTVDLHRLCDGGKKSWESLDLCNVKIQCMTRIKQSYQIHNLFLDSTEFTDPPSNFLHSCEVTSLSCIRSSLVATDSDLKPFTSVNELTIPLDIDCTLTQFTNLQILSMNMMSLGSKHYNISIQELLLGLHTHLQLTGLEIWGVETNFRLATEFVQGLATCLKGNDSNTHPATQEVTSTSCCETKKLHLLYFTIATGVDDAVRDDDDRLDIKYDILLQIVSLMKQSLVDKDLTRFNFVCHNHFFVNVLKFNTKDIDSWLKVFSLQEGFRIKYDLYGTRKDDSIRSKTESDRTLHNGLNRLSITFSKE